MLASVSPYKNARSLPCHSTMFHPWGKRSLEINLHSYDCATSCNWFRVTPPRPGQAPAPGPGAGRLNTDTNTNEGHFNRNILLVARRSEAVRSELYDSELTDCYDDGWDKMRHMMYGEMRRGSLMGNKGGGRASRFQVGPDGQTGSKF